MANKYTEPVKTGACTSLRQYLWSHIKENNGFPIRLDSDGVFRFTPHSPDLSFYDEQDKKIVVERDKVLNCTPAQLTEMAIIHHKNRLKAAEAQTERDAGKIVFRQRYEAMLGKLNPHIEKCPEGLMLAFLRGFRSELESSIQFDCPRRAEQPEVVALSPEEFKAEAEKSFEQLRQHYAQQKQLRQQEAEALNAYYQQIVDLLNSVE